MRYAVEKVGETRGDGPGTQAASTLRASKLRTARAHGGPAPHTHLIHLSNVSPPCGGFEIKDVTCSPCPAVLAARGDHCVHTATSPRLNWARGTRPPGTRARGNWSVMTRRCARPTGAGALGTAFDRPPQSCCLLYLPASAPLHAAACTRAHACSPSGRLPASLLAARCWSQDAEQRQMEEACTGHAGWRAAG